MDLQSLRILNFDELNNIEDIEFKNLLLIVKNKSFFELVKFFNSEKYSSNYLALHNYSYHLMLYLLLLSIDDYVAELNRYKTKEKLEESDEFQEVFDWFFNHEHFNYVGNFVFICDNIRLTKKSVLLLLIKLTKNRFCESEKGI